MQVEVTCPKCGESWAEDSRRVVRKLRCISCSHRFMPVREGVPCPKCGSVLILPRGRSRRTVTCLNCSFVFREPKWWQKRRYQALGFFIAVVLVFVVFALFRYWSNVRLAGELRAEYAKWLETLPKVPDSENGMLPILEGLKAFKGELPECVPGKDPSLLSEEDRALMRQYIAEREQGLRLVYEGLKYEKFLFPTDWSRIREAKFPNLPEFRNAAYALVYKSSFAAEEGRKPEALEEYLNVLRLGRTLSSSRAYISAMIEVAVLYIGLRSMTRTLSESSFAGSDLEYTLETLLQLHGKGGGFYPTMESKYYMLMFVIADIIEGKFSFGHPDWKVGWLDRLRLSKFIRNYRLDVEICRKVREIWRNIDLLKYYTLPAGVRDSLTPSWTLLKAAPTHDLLRGVQYEVIRLPDIEQIVSVLVDSEVIWRGAIALAAVRLFEARNSRLPQNIEELGNLVSKELLIDPFSGGNLIYRLTGSDFYLYSVGYNGVDHRGIGEVRIYEKDYNWKEMSDIIFHAPGGVGEDK